MYEELQAWRAGHLAASFDEIAEQVMRRRQVIMGKLIDELAAKADDQVVAPECEQCRQAMIYRGKAKRQVSHREGEVALVRAYYYCDHCRSGFFPPRPAVAVESARME